MVTLGTGIGGGIVLDGRVQVGSAGFAGEIGHMVVDPAGPPCPCGRRGCWERFASGAGLGVRAREAALAGRLGEVVRLAGGDPESVRGEDVSAAAAAGDPAAGRVIEEVGWWVGFGLANLAAVLDPECFVLGGGVAAGRRPPGRGRPGHVRGARRGSGAPSAGGDRARRLRRPGRRRRRGAGGPPGRTVVMRTGVVLPTFRDSPDEAFAAAAAAVAAGVDGVFCYDHIWPLGQPQRPALAPFPLLGALATRLGPPRRQRPGPVPGHARGARRPGPQRRVGRTVRGAGAPGAGTGDRRARHRRPAERGGEPRLRHPVPVRGRAAGRAGRAGPRAGRGRGSPCGSAAGPAGRTAEAQAAAAALTVWDAEPELVAERASGVDAVEVTWAGPPPAAAAEPRARGCGCCTRAGASWAVFGWPVDVEALVAAARAVEADPGSVEAHEESGGTPSGP